MTASPKWFEPEWRAFALRHPGVTISEVVRLTGKSRCAVSTANRAFDLGFAHTPAPERTKPSRRELRERRLAMGPNKITIPDFPWEAST